MATVMVGIRLSNSDMKRLDEARGQTPRAVYARRILLEALASASDSDD